MLFRSLLTVLGLAMVGSIGGCCTSGTCGSPTTSETCYPEATYTESAPADCGCGCSSAPTTSYDTYSQPTDAVSNHSNVTSQSGPVNDSPYYVGDAVEMNATPVVEPPSSNATSGFSAGSATKAIDNALPGNLLPNNQ